MQPEDSSLVRRSPFSIYDLLPNPTFLILGRSSGCVIMVALCRLLPMNRKCENTSWYLVLFVASFVTVIFTQTRSAVGGVGIAVFLWSTRYRAASCRAQ
jgi:hypothetical protein